MNTRDDGLKRGMKPRHLRMIALGSSIGTGLFLGSGASVQLAGPGVLVSFLIAGFIIYLFMRMLGEMAVAHPVAGSFSAYAREYIGPTAGFITGWNWWFTCIVVGMAELTAAGTFVEFWFPALPHWITALIALVAITALNLIHVGAFAEAEYWLSLVKVAALILMIVGGLALVSGLSPQPAIGYQNIVAHGGFFPTGFSGVLLSLVAVLFTFGGIESIGTAAGEAEEPEKSMPKAINTVLWRVLIFYVGGMGIVVLLAPWNELDTSTSPFVQVLDSLGVRAAASLLNAVVLLAALSVLNTMTYSGGRMLRDLSRNGQAPPFFNHTTKAGLPLRALLFNSALMGSSVLLNYFFEGRILLVLMAIIVGASIITWTAICISHLRFRRIQGKTSYPAPLFPFANYLCMAFFTLVVVLMAFLPDYRTGLIALPLWVLALGGIWIGKKHYEKKTSSQATPAS